MKKLRNVVVLLVVTLLLTGCVKYNVNMEIRKDKSMSFEMIYAVDESLLEGKDVFEEEELKEIKDKGFKVEKYSKDNMKGYTLTKEIKNIDEISSPDAKEYSLSSITEKGNKKLFKVKKGLFKNKYTANLKFNSSDSGLNSNDDDYDFRETDENDDSLLTDTEDADTDSSSLDDYDYSSMTNMDMSVNVKLPYKALSNNASSTKNNDTELKWDLSANSEESIDFEFELYNMTTIYICIAIGVVLIIGVIVLIVVLVSKSKKKKTPTTE